MMSAPLKETTMKPCIRTLLRVVIAEVAAKKSEHIVEQLMGNMPELRVQ